jgi:cytochrome P450
VDRVLGERAEITYQDIIELKYCAAVFKEALQLWPPIPFSTRVCDHEWEVDGYYIPTNTVFHLASYVSARIEKNFKNAYEFKPERFLKDKESETGYLIAIFLSLDLFAFIELTCLRIENYTYFPFGLGPRYCIGQNFAQFEAVAII